LTRGNRRKAGIALYGRTDAASAAYCRGLEPRATVYLRADRPGGSGAVAVLAVDLGGRDQKEQEATEPIKATTHEARVPTMVRKSCDAALLSVVLRRCWHGRPVQLAGRARPSEAEAGAGAWPCEGRSWLAISSSRGALHCRLRVPGGRAEPFFPSAQAGKLELAVPGPEES